jgi:predicted HAD superfamily phosphohydrolase YqeG
VKYFLVDAESALTLAVEQNPDYLILDLEPLLADWRTDQTALDAGARKAKEITKQIPVIVITNSRRGISPSILPPGWTQVSRAKKPFTHLDSGLRNRRSVVVGDQPWNDGLLAFRLRASFIQVAIPTGSPLWPRIMVSLWQQVYHVLHRIRSSRSKPDV